MEPKNEMLIFHKISGAVAFYHFVGSDNFSHVLNLDIKPKQYVHNLI